MVTGHDVGWWSRMARAWMSAKKGLWGPDTPVFVHLLCYCDWIIRKHVLWQNLKIFLLMEKSFTQQPEKQILA